MNKMLFVSLCILLAYNNIRSCEEHSKRTSKHLQIIKSKEKNTETNTINPSKLSNTEDSKKLATLLSKMNQQNSNLDEINDPENFPENTYLSDKDMNWNKLMILSCSIQ